MTAHGRNDPCTCGSGRRYKDCCGSLRGDGDALRDSEADAQRLMWAALAAQEARRLDDAERIYRDALTLSPDAADALHTLIQCIHRIKHGGCRFSRA